MILNNSENDTKNERINGTYKYAVPD